MIWTILPIDQSNIQTYQNLHVYWGLNKANLWDLIAATGLVILLKLDSNRRFFSPCDLTIWWTTSKNNRAPFLHYIKLCAWFQINQWIQNGVTLRKRSIQVKIGQIRFVSLVSSLRNNRAPLLCCVKLCASFHRHQWILTGVTIRKRPIWVKTDDLFSRVTLKFDGWPRKTIGLLVYAIGEFKLELQSGNTQFGSKSSIV